MSQMNAMQEIFPLGAGRSPDVRARVVEHSLVASFRSSNPPTVWRMDLEKNHSFAVAIQKKEQDWELGVMSPKGDFTVVARFHERADVDAAMSEVESAMFSNPNSTGIKVWRLSAMTAAMVLLIILGYALLVNLVPDYDRSLVQRHSAAPVMRSNVPQDADAILGKN